MYPLREPRILAGKFTYILSTRIIFLYILVTYTTEKYESTLDAQLLVFKTKHDQYVPFDTFITANIHEKICQDSQTPNKIVISHT